MHHINKIKNKTHKIPSVNAEKIFDKTHDPFMVKTLSRVGKEGTYLNIIKALYDKPTANSILSGEKVNTFSLSFRTRQRCTFLQLLFGIVLEVLA